MPARLLPASSTVPGTARRNPRWCMKTMSTRRWWSWRWSSLRRQAISTLSSHRAHTLTPLPYPDSAPPPPCLIRQVTPTKSSIALPPQRSPDCFSTQARPPRRSPDCITTNARHDARQIASPRTTRPPHSSARMQVLTTAPSHPSLIRHARRSPRRPRAPPRPLRRAPARHRPRWQRVRA